jgi:hypothetical protein
VAVFVAVFSIVVLVVDVRSLCNFDVDSFNVDGFDVDSFDVDSLDVDGLDVDVFVRLIL